MCFRNIVSLIFFFSISAVSSSCSYFVTGFKRDPGSHKISVANSILDKCRLNDLQSCEEFYNFISEYKFYPDNEKLKDNVLKVDIGLKLCLDFKVNSYCAKASGDAIRIDDLKSALRICKVSMDPESCMRIFDSKFLPDLSVTDLVYVSHACDDKNERNCREIYNFSLTNKTKVLLSNICNRDVSIGCLYEAYFEKELSYNPATRKILYQKSCQLGNRDGCEALETIDLSINTFNCEKDSSDDFCYDAAKLLILSNLRYSHYFAEKGCSNGGSSSCTILNTIRERLDDEKRVSSSEILNFLAAFAGAYQNTNQGASYQTNLNNYGCGLKPLPNLGCYIGNCVNGSWQQICDQSGTSVCGLKPLPNLGCHIGNCVNGSWQQICNDSGATVCGLKPIPKIGCYIGNCINSKWEEVCN